MTMKALQQLLGGSPMRGQQVLPGLYDPTGLSFDHAGGGTSTELGSIQEFGSKFGLAPLLVPGQVGIEELLSGQPIPEELRRKQAAIAAAYARSRMSEVPLFDTVPAAEEYEQRRHEGLNRDYRPSNPADLLSWIYQAMGSR